MPMTVIKQHTTMGNMPEHSPARSVFRTVSSAVLLAMLALAAPVRAQTHAAPTVDPAATADAGRPIPGPIFEIPGFTRAVESGSRTRSGSPGAKNWVQYARYSIDARLDAANARLEGREKVVYINNSPDTLATIAVHLRQNVFAPGNPRRSAVPITGGVKLGRVAAAGKLLRSAASSRALRSLRDGGYTVDGAVMWLRLPTPLLPHDSTSLEFAWSYSPAPAPSDGREGREGKNLYFIGYWYPQVAVYDDVNGWVADPYINGAEFYMDPADYDVRVTVPHGWPVGATGTLLNGDSVLSRQTRDRLARARTTREVVHVLTAADRANGSGFAGSGKEARWHFTAKNVRDFAWGTSSQYDWDATIALVDGARAGTTDTVAINSFFRVHPPAAAWPLGGARFTRDAIEKLSDYLWSYPWPQMTSMEGVISSGGMEYPMMTLMQSWPDTLSLAGDLMHETGHMWFPMQVGSNETRHPWMDEGLTQYDVAQAMRVIYGEPRKGGRPNDSEPGQRSVYLQQARAGREMALMTPGELSDLDLYFVMYYNKTAQVLSALRAVLGNDTFHRALREYGKRWIGRHPYPADFFNTMSDVSGRDLTWFWRSWFYEPWSLDQAIGSVRANGDSVAITVEDRGLATMPVILEVKRVDGTTQRVEAPVDVWLKGARRWVATVAASPAIASVEIDPEGLFPDLDRGNQRWTP